MQDAPLLSFPAPSPSKSDHKCQDCLYMELKAVSNDIGSDGTVDPFLLSNPTQASFQEQADLYLSIQFGEQEEVLPGGFIKFGLKGGTLRLNLENCEMPLSNLSLFDHLETTISTERHIKNGEEYQSAAEVAFAENKLGTKANLGEKKTSEKSDKYSFTICQVSTKGSPQNPAWVFEEKMGEPVLIGLLKESKLGTLNVNDKPCHITATFKVSLKNITMTRIDGPWMVDIIPEERAVLDRAFALLLLKHKLHPYLSKLELFL